MELAVIKFSELIVEMVEKIFAKKACSNNGNDNERIE